MTTLRELEKQGYKFHINADGYFVTYKNHGIGGASVKLPRSKPIHWKHAQKNRADNAESAKNFALNHWRGLSLPIKAAE
jgi:hypothetical protein